jgi:phosphoesterase RecJ-like protein
VSKLADSQSSAPSAAAAGSPADEGVRRVRAWGPVLEALRRGTRFLLTAHENLDGDAAGAEAALARLLHGQGKTVACANPTPTPARYRWMLEEAGVAVTAGRLPEGYAPDTLVVLDAGNWKQTGVLADTLAALDCTKVCLDHHVGYAHFVPAAVVDSTACATSLLVYELAGRVGATVDRSMADALFVGIASDTGWFRFDNTDGRALAAASALTARGARPSALYAQVQGGVPVEQIRLLGLALSSVAFAAGGRIAWIAIDEAMLARAGTGRMETENLLDHVKYLAGVDVAVLFKEVEGGTRVSLRSRERVDVSRLAAGFGGGGHVRAAGATLAQPLPAARQAVLGAIGRALNGAG